MSLKKWFDRVRRMFGGRTPLTAPAPSPPPPPPPPPSSVIANVTLPRLVDGPGNTVTAPIVGQQMFVDVGTWLGSPGNFAWRAFDDAGAIGDAAGTVAASGEGGFIVTDAEVGRPLHLSVIASNGLSSLEALSTATSNVADIDLTNAITAFTRTSSSGITPMTWSLTLGANVYEGYYLLAKVYSDSGLSTLTQDVAHLITGPDMVAGATIDLTSDGLTSIGATDWLQLTVETTSPNGIFHSFAFPTALSPTDASVAMTWSTTDAATIGATLSGGNLTVTRGGGYANLKGSRGIGSGKKVYWEITPNFAAAMSVADASAVLTDYWAPAFAGGTQTVHAAMYSGNDSSIYYDASATGVTGFGASDVIGVALDTTVSPAKVYFAKNNVWQQSGAPASGTGGQAMASISSPIYPAAQIGGGHSLTANFGTTPGGTAGFTYTPPTGFVAP